MGVDKKMKGKEKKGRKIARKEGSTWRHFRIIEWDVKKEERERNGERVEMGC